MDPCAEGGVRILIKESSIKVIEMCRVEGKARLINEKKIMSRQKVGIEVGEWDTKI